MAKLHANIKIIFSDKKGPISAKLQISVLNKVSNRKTMTRTQEKQYRQRNGVVAGHYADSNDVADISIFSFEAILSNEAEPC